MTSQSYLQRKPDLSKWWSEITNDPRFDEIILIAGADIILLKDNAKMSGATEILESLKTMVAAEPSKSPIPTPGTVHEYSKG